MESDSNAAKHVVDPSPSASSHIPSSTRTTNNNVHEKEQYSPFECNICLETASEPVVTICGHLFCWPCLFKWLETQQLKTCPVCKAEVTTEKIIPIYGRGKEQTFPGLKTPSRPAGQRTEPDPQQHAQRFGFFPPVPTGPFATAQFGNVTFSACFSIFPSLGLQFQTYPHVHSHPTRAEEVNMEQAAQQAFLSRLLFMTGTFVVICLLLFN